jgi:hypothetical protein
MKNMAKWLAMCGILTGASAFAQETDTTSTPSPKIKFSDIVQIHGYVKNLNIVSISENPLIGNSTDNFLHNRINLKITPGKGLLIGPSFERVFFMQDEQPPRKRCTRTTKRMVASWT